MVRNLDAEDVNTVHLADSNQRGNPNKTVINESGLYTAIFASKLKAAKQFRRWVTKDVLPGQENDPLFIAKDVATALAYYDPKQAVRQHCKRRKSLSDFDFPAGLEESSTPRSYKERRLAQLGHGPKVLGLHPQTQLIPESLKLAGSSADATAEARDVYRLVMRSNLPSAEQFQDWGYNSYPLHPDTAVIPESLKLAEARDVSTVSHCPNSIFRQKYMIRVPPAATRSAALPSLIMRPRRRWGAPSAHQIQQRGRAGSPDDPEGR
jgi:prophage antirepressor-like protein